MPENPQEKEVQPPFEEEKQAPPGLESEMDVAPDYGAESYRGSGRLRDRAAIVTGGDSGIGRAVALAFAREGADVVVSYLNEEEDAAETRRVVEAAGRRCVLVPGDIGDEAHCVHIVERALQEFGRIDVLVNNAAFQMSREGLAALPTDELEKTFRTNVFAMFYLCRAALRHITEGGSIINTSSVQAYDPSPNLIAYAATKAAIVNFTKALSQEAAERGVRVNAVAPGPVWTPLIPSTMPPEQVKEFGKSVPLKRPGQPAELAPAYVFLASDEASYITGEVLGVTGGKILP